MKPFMSCEKCVNKNLKESQVPCLRCDIKDFKKNYFIPDSTYTEQNETPRERCMRCEDFEIQKNCKNPITKKMLFFNSNLK